MTAITMPKPITVQPGPTPAASPHSGQPTSFCYATVNLAGRLYVIDAPNGGAGLFPLGRRNTTGRVYRIELADDIACWLDGDHVGGAVNPIATQICAALSSRPNAGWGYRTFVGGPVVLTGLDAAGEPVGLSDAQLTRIADEHAHAEEWDL